jgi:hypothetical protein
VFKNPPGEHAARLIEAAGLKGHRIGDAVVSEKHANFILNLGPGDAPAELEAVDHDTCNRRWSTCTASCLEPEVRIVGEPALMSARSLTETCTDAIAARRQGLSARAAAGTIRARGRAVGRTARAEREISLLSGQGGARGAASVSGLDAHRL